MRRGLEEKLLFRVVDNNLKGNQREGRMATQEHRRIIKQWAEWILFHTNGDKYQLCRYDDLNQEYYRTSITAADDAAALGQCGSVVRQFDRRRDY